MPLTRLPGDGGVHVNLDLHVLHGEVVQVSEPSEIAKHRRVDPLFGF